TITADQCGQQVGRQQSMAAVFQFADDLQQYLCRDVGLRLAFDHLERNAFLDQLANFAKRDVAAFLGVVQSPVRILLDDAGVMHDDDAPVPQLCRFVSSDSQTLWEFPRSDSSRGLTPRN